MPVWNVRNRAPAIERAEVKALLRISVEYKNGEATEPLKSGIYHTWDSNERYEDREDIVTKREWLYLFLVTKT